MSHISHTHFEKGDQVEVLKRQNGSNTLTYYVATVLRSPAKQKTQILIEYQSLMINQKCLRELVHLGSVRPVPPRQLNEYFKMEDNVDVFCDNGWQKGTIKEILENSKYVVGFDSKSEGIVAEQCNLRLHREWDDGSWVPPLFEQKKMFPPTDMKSRKMKLKIKCSKRKSEPMFRPGARVEVKSDEEGYNGAWYGAIIIGTIGTDKILVQYLNLVTDDETAPLKEATDIEHIRPWPPSVSSDGHFKQFEKVDAWFNEGWWEGEVSGVLRGLKYMVYFSSTNEKLEFDHSVLRHHQEWINGKWIKGQSIELEGNERNPKEKFCKGTRVEVKSDEVGFQGAWFSAIITDELGNDKFIVKYHSLLTDDGTDSLREEASASDLRPSPPYIQCVCPFKLFEMVDAWLNDGWWVGRIIKVHKDLKYTVYFKTTEELEFEHCDLRPHQEWIGGDWFPVPKDWEL